MTIAQQLFLQFQGVSPSALIDNNGRSRPKPKVMACSAMDRSQKRLYEITQVDRTLCEDRKTPLEHFYIGQLTKSTIRIVVTQTTFIVSNYANDQLLKDSALNELVAKGKMTRAEADQEADEWESREWQARFEVLPSKITEALLKYHAIVLVMRLYEHLLAKFADKLTLDSLTLDTFKMAKRIDAVEHNKTDVGKQMFHICGKANIIAFLADFSVHQAILCYGYFRFVMERKRRRQIKAQSRHPEFTDGKDTDDDNKDDEKAPRIVKETGLLIMSRSLGLGFTAVGGALGSMLLPGWGTMIGCNLGDSMGGAVTEGTTALIDH